MQKGRKRKRPPSATEVAPLFDSVSVDEWSNACRYRCPMCPDGGEEEGGPPFRFASQSSLREHVHSAHRGVLGADVNLSDFVAGCRTDTRCAEGGNIFFFLLFPLSSCTFRFLICAVCGKDVIRDREDLSAHFRRHRKMTVEDYFAMHASPVASGKGKKG